MLKGLWQRPQLPPLELHDLPAHRYPELGRRVPEGSRTQYCRAIFVTGRFRSGSTLLWLIFRNIPGCTAYYEPFNERRWFNASARGEWVDPSHRGVGDYWREYEGLDELARYYDQSWTTRQLYMDAGEWSPPMKEFIDVLINRAPDRPVLQFNRVDFRLPWLRRNFTGSKVVHIYRHPREQWCSTVGAQVDFTRHGSMREFQAHDEFYLNVWARDLRYQFPFLESAANEHPYRTFYYLWKLSYLFGLEYADASIALEDLVADPRSELRMLFKNLDIQDYDMEALCALVKPVELDRWRHYANDDWFKAHERACEEVLSGYFPAKPKSNSYDRTAAGAHEKAQ